MWYQGPTHTFRRRWSRGRPQCCGRTSDAFEGPEDPEVVCDLVGFPVATLKDRRTIPPALSLDGQYQGTQDVKLTGFHRI